MSESPKILSFVLDSTVESTPANKILSEQLTEELITVFRRVPNVCGLIIISHDFELSLKEASYIVNTTPKVMEMMLENSGIISAGRTIKAHNLLKFMKQWSDQKRKSFEEIVEYTEHLFGTD